MVRMSFPGLVALGVATILVSAGSGGPARSATRDVRANLRAVGSLPNSEVTAAFTASLTGNRLSWRLTQSGIRAGQASAHIHLGGSASPGKLVVRLCDPCQSPARGSYTVPSATAEAIRKGGAFVDLHSRHATAAFARGQLGSGDPSAGEMPTLNIVSPKDGDLIIPPTQVRFTLSGLASTSKSVRIEASIGTGADMVSVLLESDEPPPAGAETWLATFPADKRFSGKHDITFVVVNADGTRFENDASRVSIRELEIRAGR